MIKLRLLVITFVALLFCIPSIAGEKLSLKDITGGKFRLKTMTEVCTMNDGRTMPRSVMTENGLSPILSRQEKKLVSFLMLQQHKVQRLRK